MSRTSMPWSRLAAEFVVIVVGVLVALSADSWAEQRAEVGEARAGLSLVLADLEADSAQYVGNRIKMAEWERNAAWLVANWWRPDLPEDSVEAAFQSFTVGETLQFSRAGFDGLRDSNRLRLISDDSLRTALQDYYQRGQTQLTLALDKTIELADELPRIAAPHLRYEQDVG